jgi:hypothetical protein
VGGDVRERPGYRALTLSGPGDERFLRYMAARIVDDWVHAAVLRTYTDAAEVCHRVDPGGPAELAMRDALLDAGTDESIGAVTLWLEPAKG